MKNIVLALSMAILASCATTKQAVKTSGTISLNCAVDGITSKASQIVPAILAILQTAGETWRDQAEMYAVAYGRDVAICAARNALEKLSAPVQSEGLAADPVAVKRLAETRVRWLELEAGYAQ